MFCSIDVLTSYVCIRDDNAENTEFNLARRLMYALIYCLSVFVKFSAVFSSEVAAVKLCVDDVLSAALLAEMYSVCRFF